MVRFALLALLAVSANAGIPSDSKLGKKLLEKSRRLDQERDVSWMPDYSIKFEKCHSLVQVASEENGGGEGEGLIYTQHLIEFALCPSDSCTDGSSAGRSCAKYIANMREFVELYTQFKQEEKEQRCEAVRENCNNDDENYCFAQAGLDECIEVEGEEEEDMDKYMDCENLDVDGGNNNGNNYNYNNANYYREYFVGPYCSSNGKAIHLGVFLDEGCSVPAESGVYESMNYGKSLPYSSDSIVEMDCISCEAVDENANNNNNNNNNNGNNNNNNNNNQQEDVQLIELCEQTYEQAGRCEKNLGITYPDETACEFIESILPKLEGVSRSLGVYTGPNTAAVVCAWVFGILAFALGVYSFLLYRRLKRSKVALNADVQDGATSA